MAHPNEPSLAKLRKMEKKLFTEESTDENMQRLKAIQVQIKRREKEEKLAEAEASV